MRDLLLTLLCSCATQRVVKVEIVKEPDRSTPIECWGIPRPDPIPDPVWPQESQYDGNEFGKMFIHRRDFEALVQWTRDWDHWAKLVDICVSKLRE